MIGIKLELNRMYTLVPCLRWWYVSFASMTIYCQMCKFSLLLLLLRWYNKWGNNIFVELVGGGPS